MITQIQNDPLDLVRDALRGYAAQHMDLINLNENPTFVIRAVASPRAKVAIVSGGGSGHEPLHIGFVGSGMLDAAVPGQLFASPNAAQVLGAIRAVDRGAGTLLIVKNYTGDILNFTLAANEAAEDGLLTELVKVDDDLASESDDPSGPGRRGTGATLIVEKLCGAAAERGDNLPEIVALARAVGARSRSIAVAFRSATLPGHTQPSFEVNPGEIEFGVGIHGERGRAQESPSSGSVLVEGLVERLAGALDLQRGDEVIALVNDLGGSSGLHLAATRLFLAEALDGRGIGIARSLTGSFVTALDMQGVSITLTRVQPGDLELWDFPVRTAALTW